MNQLLNLPEPTPDVIRKARKKAGLTQEQAAIVVGASSHRVWYQWESSTDKERHRQMSSAVWELFLIKVFVIGEDREKTKEIERYLKNIINSLD